MPNSEAKEKTPEEEQQKYVFPEEYKEALTGLTYLGSLTKTFKYKGHQFVIHTPNMKNMLEVLDLAETFEGKIAQNSAQKVAMVAMVVDEVDGESLYEKISETDTDRDALRKKFDVISTWFPSTVDAVYKELGDLWIKEQEVLRVLG